MAQAESICKLLQDKNQDLEIEIVAIKTSGDQGLRDRLGAFVREIQEALLDGRVDIAQHCLKDLPTTAIEGLSLSCYLEREDPCDCWISRSEDWSVLPEKSTTGTGSVRRTSQLASIRPDLNFLPLMGNVDTRMRKLMAGEYDSIVLARAGLSRLGVLEGWDSSEYASLKVHPIPTDVMLPAPGQGVIVLETRAQDANAISPVLPLHHEDSKVTSLAERAFLSEFGGGCSTPIASLAIVEKDRLHLTGLVAAPDGQKICRGTKTGDCQQPVALGKALAKELIADGAMELFTVARGQ